MFAEKVNKCNLTNYLDELQELALPCVTAINSNRKIEIGCSKVGGFPHVTDDFKWPTRNGFPLEFVAQLKCSEIDIGNLPKKGLLLFFYSDSVWQPSKGNEHFRVIYLQESIELKELEPPYKYKKRFFGLLKPQSIPKIFDEYVIEFQDSLSLPDLDNEETIPGLKKYYEDDYLLDCYCDLKYSLNEASVIQVGGFPNPVQNDNLASSAAAEMGKGKSKDWKLLLEVDSQLGFMWGDAGRLYFYIHESDLNNVIFSEVWFDTQCH